MPINNPTLDALFPRGIRNYNPGNIQNGPFAKSQPGYVGSDGRFAQFDTMDNGLAAHSALLDSYGNKGLNTLNAIINRWAPSSDGNRPANYAAFVGKKLGIDPNQPLDMSDPNVRKKLAVAMGTFENGMTPTDPRSWMASGSPQPATGAPMQLPGAVAPNTQQQGAQTISLGDEENQQPFNNIGSTLANMGASIASLDNRGTGIASLNASRVAANLASQEAAREKEGGWKYAGQTQNGQGLMFQNSKGEIRVEPLSPQFAGQKDPESLRVLDALAADPQRMAAYQKMNGIGEASNYDEDGKWKYETSPEDIDTLIKRAAAGEGNDVLKGQTKKTRADFNHRVTEMGIAPETFAAGKANQSGQLQQSREFGRRQGVLEIAVPKLQTDISVARDLLQQYRKENPNGSWKGWNWLKNASTEEFTGPGAQTLAKLKETFKTLTDQFATVQQSGQLTEASRQEASKLINENMDTGVAEAVLDNMQSLGVRSLNSVRQAHENHMARIMKQPIPHPELEVDPDAKKSSSTTGSSKRLKYNPQTGELE